MDETDRAPFEQMANKLNKAKQRHDRLMEECDGVYHDKSSKAWKKAKKIARQLNKDPNAPKRPMTAFFLFSGENREEAKKTFPAGTRFSVISKELGKQWKALKPKDKKKYQDQAEKQKEQYKKDMKAYKNE